MRIIRIMSDLTQERMRALMDEIEAIAIDPGVAESLEEFELAYHLAKKSFKEKKNIARSLRYEFMLWLTGKIDIRSAMAISAPKDLGRGFFLVIFQEPRQISDNEIAGKLGAEILPLELKKVADPLALERISLSRLK